MERYLLCGTLLQDPVQQNIHDQPWLIAYPNHIDAPYRSIEYQLLICTWIEYQLLI